MTTPEKQDEAFDLAIDWLRSTAARTIALRVVPVLMPTVGIFLAWLQDAIGLDLDPTVVATVLGSALIGASSVILTWVRNHGRGARDIAVTLLETHDTYEYGRRTYDKTVGPGKHGG